MERPDKKNTGKETAMPNLRTPMTDRIQCLSAQGYSDDFQMTENGLKSLKTGQIFEPKDIKIIEHLRFEGISNPEDMAILYIIETNTGLKGTVIDAFGVYGDRDLMDFMKKVEDLTIENIAKSTVKDCCN